MKTSIRFFLIWSLVCAMLNACGPSQAELDASATQAAVDDSATQTAKAPTATYTPTVTQTPVPTATPEPTSTPTPIPTDTPTPTPIPYIAGEFVDGKLVLTRLDSMYLMDLGQSWHDDGYYSSEIYMYNAMLEYSLKPDLLAEVAAKLGQDYAALGHYDLAIEHYLQVLDLGAASEDVTSFSLNEICWIYTITNQAQDALPYCDESIALKPGSVNLDTRGVAYAVLGRYPDAASDFKAALELDGWPSDEMKAERQEWVAALEAGTNPITSEVLERELIEEAPLTLDPMYIGDLKLSYLRSTYEEMGYEFTETTFGEEEIPGLSGTLIDSDCMSMIFLAGDENNIVFANSFIDIEHCGDDITSARAWLFNYGFVRDYDEWARALVWQAADWYYVIEGDKHITALSPTFSGCQFTVERTEIEGTEYIQVIAKPAE